MKNKNKKQNKTKKAKNMAQKTADINKKAQDLCLANIDYS